MLVQFHNTQAFAVERVRITPPFCFLWKKDKLFCADGARRYNLGTFRFPIEGFGACLYYVFIHLLLTNLKNFRL